MPHYLFKLACRPATLSLSGNHDSASMYQCHTISSSWHAGLPPCLCQGIMTLPACISATLSLQAGMPACHPVSVRESCLCQHVSVPHYLFKLACRPATLCLSGNHDSASMYQCHIISSSWHAGLPPCLCQGIMTLPACISATLSLQAGMPACHPVSVRESCLCQHVSVPHYLFKLACRPATLSLSGNHVSASMYQCHTISSSWHAGLPPCLCQGIMTLPACISATLSLQAGMPACHPVSATRCVVPPACLSFCHPSCHLNSPNFTAHVMICCKQVTKWK